MDILIIGKDFASGILRVKAMSAATPVAN